MSSPHGRRAGDGSLEYLGMIEGQIVPHSTGLDPDPAGILGIAARDEFEMIGRKQREIHMGRGPTPRIARRVTPTAELTTIISKASASVGAYDPVNRCQRTAIPAGCHQCFASAVHRIRIAGE